MILRRRVRLAFCLCMLFFSSVQTVYAELITGDWLFCAVGWNGEFTHIDSSGGQVSPNRTDLPLYMNALAVEPDGTLYSGVSLGELFKLDPLTGDTILCYDTNLRSLTALAFSSSDDLYFSSGLGAMGVYDIDTDTIESIGSFTGDVDYCQGLAFSPDGQLYGVVPHNHAAGSYDYFQIDFENAVTHLIGTYEGNLNQSLVFTPDGRLFGLGTNGKIVSTITSFAEMDPTTGAIIGQVFTFPGDYRGLALVPEPATLAFLALGGIFITTSRRRRNNHS